MPKRPGTYLTEAEEERLLRGPDRRKIGGLRDWVILKLFLSTGLRRAELVSLTRSSFREEEDELWLDVIGKGGYWRELPVVDEKLLKALRRYWRKVNISDHPEAPVFLTLKPTDKHPARPITGRVVQTIVEKYVKEAGLTKRISPHSFRHTFCTRALKKSGNLAAVSKLMGHKNVATTSLYLHASQSEMREVVRSLNL